MLRPSSPRQDMAGTAIRRSSRVAKVRPCKLRPRSTTPQVRQARRACFANRKKPASRACSMLFAEPKAQAPNRSRPVRRPVHLPRTYKRKASSRQPETTSWAASNLVCSMSGTTHRAETWHQLLLQLRRHKRKSQSKPRSPAQSSFIRLSAHEIVPFQACERVGHRVTPMDRLRSGSGVN